MRNPELVSEKFESELNPRALSFIMSLENNFTTSTTTVAPSPINPPLTKCNYFVIKNNQTYVLDFSNQYGGIPQNIVFNLIGWLVLMALFAFLRRAAGNYGRWALVRKDQDSEAKWTELFFAPDDVTVENEDSRHPRNSIDVEYAEEAAEDRRVGAWILSIFTLSDEKYMRKCGVDAVNYLKFQRHLIVFVGIITIACVGIVLPINFQGK